MSISEEGNTLDILHIADIQIGIFSSFEDTHRLSDIRNEKEELEVENPSNFPKEYKRKFGGVIEAAGDSICECAVEPLLRRLREKKENPDLIVLSGDVVSTGAWEEFKVALRFMRELVTGLSESGVSTLVIPGNHDVNWSENRERRLDNYSSFLSQIYTGDNSRIFNPNDKIYVPWIHEENEDPSPSEMISIADFTDRYNTILVGLNTAELESEEFNWGFVGANQLNALKEWSSCDDESGVFRQVPETRIAVLHHNPLPYHREPDESDNPPGGVFLNSANVLERLQECHFDLVLHGHQHRDEVKQISAVRPTSAGKMAGDLGDPLYVAGAGPFGAAQEERGEDVSRTYSSIRIFPTRRLSQELCRIQIDEWSADYGRWEESQTLATPAPLPAERREKHSKITADFLLSLLLPCVDSTEALEIVLQALQSVTEPEVILALRYDESHQNFLEYDIECSNVSSSRQKFIKNSFTIEQKKKKYIFPNGPNIFTSVVKTADGESDAHIPPTVDGRCVDSEYLHGYHFLIDTSHYTNDVGETYDYEIVSLFASEEKEVTGPMLVDDGRAELCQTNLPSLLEKCFAAHEYFLHEFIQYLDDGLGADYTNSHEDIIRYNQGQEDFGDISWSEACGVFVENDQEPFLNEEKLRETLGRLEPAHRPRLREEDGSLMSSREYKRLERPLYLLKRRIEKLIILSLAGSREEDVDEIVDALIHNVRGDRRYRENTESVSGHALDPRLVSFYLPPQNNAVDDDSESQVRFFPTRDQLAWLLSRSWIRDSKRFSEKVETFVNHKFKVHGGSIFEGLAAYVYDTGKPYFSENGFGEPVVSGSHLHFWEQILSGGKSEDINWLQPDLVHNLNPDFESIKEKRDDINDIEETLWHVEIGKDTLHVVDVPVVYRGSTLGVVQIQSEVGEAIKTLVPSVLSIIQEVSLPLVLGLHEES